MRCVHLNVEIRLSLRRHFSPIARLDDPPEKRALASINDVVPGVGHTEVIQKRAYGKRQARFKDRCHPKLTNIPYKDDCFQLAPHETMHTHAQNRVARHFI
jgi:hypothetical protein